MMRTKLSFLAILFAGITYAQSDSSMVVTAPAEPVVQEDSGIPSIDSSVAAIDTTDSITTPADSITSSIEVEPKKRWLSFKEGWSIGVNAYQIAPGLSIAKTLIKDRLHLRLGANELVYTLPSSVLEPVLTDTTMQGGGVLNIGRGYLALDLQVKGIFSITAGAQYNDFSGQLVFAKNTDHIIEGTVDNNGTPMNALITVPKELIGNIRIDMETAKFAPFAGLALGRAVPKKRVGFRFEFGAVFQGATKFTLQEKLIDTGIVGADGSNITYLIGEADDPADTESVSRSILDDIQTLNDRMAKYPVLPYISLSINVRL